MTHIYNFSPEELNKPISEIGVVFRAQNVLDRLEINTLGELVELVENHNLNKIYGMGRIRINDILDKLAEMQSPEYHAKQEQCRLMQLHIDEINNQIKGHDEAIAALDAEAEFYRAQIAMLNNAHQKRIRKR